MKTFAQLKKDMKEGTKVKTIYNAYKPERNGQVRTIGKVQTNAIAFCVPEEEQQPNIFGEVQKLSWLWWKKANNYEYEGDTVKIYDEYKGERVLSFIYKILEIGA